jgi:hypothetical protein
VALLSRKVDKLQASKKDKAPPEGPAPRPLARREPVEADPPKRRKLVEAELPTGVKECIVGKLVFGSSDSRMKVGVVSGASSGLWE